MDQRCEEEGLITGCKKQEDPCCLKCILYFFIIFIACGFVYSVIVGIIGLVYAYMGILGPSPNLFAI